MPRRIGIVFSKSIVPKRIALFSGSYSYAFFARCEIVVMTKAKQDVEHLLTKLPDNASVEDIQYHLYVLDKVRRGLADAQTNGTISQEDVESRLRKWLTE
jgi:hypothetical protein